jgi:hypothetical protein
MPSAQSSMTQPTEYADFPPEIPFSTWFRGALSVAAVMTSILPVPVLFLGLLPVYTAQAEFLVFYTPLVCFLTLSYLLYVREILARAMFADLLNPPPELDLYYGEPQGASLRRFFRRVRAAMLVLLPVALLLISSYSAVQYLSLIHRSVDQVAEQKFLERTAAPSTVQTGDSARLVPNDTMQVQASMDSLRRAVLRTARIDDIPRFNSLNVLFVIIFVSAEVAFILMALKEYAREAMGLTERDLLLGRNSADAP